MALKRRQVARCVVVDAGEVVRQRRCPPAPIPTREIGALQAPQGVVGRELVAVALCCGGGSGAVELRLRHHPVRVVHVARRERVRRSGRIADCLKLLADAVPHGHKRATLELAVLNLTARPVRVRRVRGAGFDGPGRCEDFPEQSAVVVVVPVIERVGSDREPLLGNRVPEVTYVRDCRVQGAEDRRAAARLRIRVACGYPAIGIVAEQRCLPCSVRFAGDGGQAPACVRNREWSDLRAEHAPGENSH